MMNMKSKLKGLFKNRKGGFATIIVIVIVVVIAVALLSKSLIPIKNTITTTSTNANTKIDTMTKGFINETDTSGN